MRPMTEAEIEEAARNDPDARPMTDEEFARAKRVPRVKTLRRALGLAQEELAARDRIPLGTLRGWEQDRSEPDQPSAPILPSSPTTPMACGRLFTSGRHTKQDRRPAQHIHSRAHMLIHDASGCRTTIRCVAMLRNPLPCGIRSVTASIRKNRFFAIKFGIQAKSAL